MNRSQALGRQVTALLELRRRTNHLEFYRKELERSNRELQEFAYVASHDLKEPVRGVRHLANFLIDDHGDQLDQEAHEKIDRMIRLTDRMQKLVDRLLHYARVGSVVDRHRSVDLNDVVRHVRESLVGQIEKESVTIETAELPVVKGEQLLVEELLQNLVSNAIKYNKNEAKLVRIGYVTINHPETEAPMTSFYVADNGIGIPENFRSEVFTIFRRLHLPDEYGGGTGAGLTIVRKIIETHGGNIWIDDSYQDGTCFWFSFDRVDESMTTVVSS